MDNFKIDITCEGDDALRAAINVVFTQQRSAVAWNVDKDKGLVFYWTNSENAIPFPFPHDAEAVFNVIKAWLPLQDYGREPNHDGSNGKGWRIYNEAWGHIGNDYRAFLAVLPNWAWYGK